jgi:hypothetical protein
MKIQLSLNMVSMPNFLTIESLPSPRQVGFKPKLTVAIQELSFEQASAYAEEMRLAFIEHWKSKGGIINPTNI